MIAARFDFDGDNAIGIARERHGDPRETLAAMRAVVPLTRTPIAPRPTRLVEAIVHGEDNRRPLGIATHYAPEAVAAALAYQVKTAVAIGGGRERVEGLRLVATDSAFESGGGDEVRGRGVDLLLAMSGRAVDVGAFDGPGGPRLSPHLTRVCRADADSSNKRARARQPGDRSHGRCGVGPRG